MEWVTDKKPAKLEAVIVTCEDRGGCRYTFEAWWDGSSYRDRYDGRIERVVAWMPLPEPYKGE